MLKACNLPFWTTQMIHTGFTLCLKIGSYDIPIQGEIYPQYLFHDKHGNSKLANVLRNFIQESYGVPSKLSQPTTANAQSM